MMTATSCAYAGTVVHKRLIPKVHAFAYHVFSLCLDVDDIDRLSDRLRWFSRNKRNVVSFYDCDHGDGTGANIADQIRSILASAGLHEACHQISLVCYPRVFGYVFNPLSVYFCHQENGSLRAVVYEVNNTFGERKSYVVPVALGAAPVIAQRCAKQLYVSPFTSSVGQYRFHVLPPGDRLVIGVAFATDQGATLKTHFRGQRRALTDESLVYLMLQHPLMTLKVTAAIHLEAARLWRKGVPTVARHSSPAFSFTVVQPEPKDATNAEP